MENQNSFGWSNLPLVTFLVKLRRRVFFVLATMGVVFAVGWPNSERIMAFVEAPLLPYTKLTFDTLTAPFITHFKATAYAALFFSLPVAVVQVWLLARPSLGARERRAIWPFLLLSYPLFVGGALFCYYVAFPPMVGFLIGFDPAIVPSIRVDDYLTFVLRLLIAFGLIFELPLATLLLTRMGLVTPEWLARNRRYAVVIVFMAAAAITPPDVLSMLMLALPLLVLFEISILVARLARPRNRPQP